MNAIELRDLRKVYPGFTLDNLTLSLPSGCIMGLIGENGAGKTTTVKLILNMIRRDGGEVLIYGKNIDESYPLGKEAIGVVLDEVNFSECLTPGKVGRIMRQVYRNWDDAAYAALVERFDLPERKTFREFSLGMKKRLGIAVALAHHAKLLVLDEPTSGLDPVARDDFLDLLAEFTRDEEHAVLISSHIVSDLEKLCDYIAFLKAGKLMLCEEKDRLYEEYALAHCTAETFRTLDTQAVLGSRETPYGVEALMRRDHIPQGMETGQINVEELFVLMAKGGKGR